MSCLWCLIRERSEMHDPHPPVPACLPPSARALKQKLWHSAKAKITLMVRRKHAKHAHIQREIIIALCALDILRKISTRVAPDWVGGNFPAERCNSALGEAHKIYCVRFYCYHLMRISTQIGAFIKRRVAGDYIRTVGGVGGHYWQPPLEALQENPPRAPPPPHSQKHA
jgi:hypothetical protein